jgi:thioredoxin-related protein
MITVAHINFSLPGIKNIMFKINQMLFLLIFLLSYNPVWAEAEFSDAPVDQIIHPDWFKQSFLDLKEDVAEAKQSAKAGIIVFFEQPHCAYCNALITNVFGDAAIAQYTQKHFDVVTLDIYGDRTVTDFTGANLSEGDYAMKLKAELTPTLDFYDTDNNLVFRLRGYYPPEKFKSALHYVVEKHYLTQRFRDYLATSEAAVNVAVADDKTSGLFIAPPYKLDRSKVITDKPLMVLFEKGDCKTCKQLHDDTLKQTIVHKLMAHFDAIQLDMWSDTPVITPAGKQITAVEWAENMGLFYAPTIVFFDESGTEIYRIDSLVKLRRLSGILRYIVSGDYTDEPNYESWKAKQAETK